MKKARLRGLHSICFIRDSVCNLIWGDGQRATHCFVVYNGKQCFRMFVSFVPLLTLVLMQFLNDLVNKAKILVLELFVRTVHHVCGLCFCSVIASQ